MIQVGITGGIGSGKTTVCNIFKELGVPIYFADQRAKDLYIENADVKKKVIELLGEGSYTTSGEVNKAFIAQHVFQDKTQLTALNAIIHPAVRTDYEHWCKNQTAAYVLREAAILIESGAYQTCDKIIVVTAPEALRIERVVQRDQTSEQEVKNRIMHQLTDIERLEYADFEIINDGEQSLVKQVLAIHQALVNEA